MSQLYGAYAQALYDLAGEEDCEKQILQELAQLQEVFAAEPDFITLLSAPNISKEERCEVLDKSFRERVHSYVLNFLKLLVQKGYIRHFDACCKAYTDLYNAQNGIMPVQAVTALPLTQDQHSRLAAKLTEITGKTVRLVNRVDPKCLGGVRLDYDGKRVDGTVKCRLDAIGDLLKNTEV